MEEPKETLEKLIKELESNLNNFPEDYTPEYQLLGINIIMLEKGIGEMLKIYQRSVLEKNPLYDIEGDEIFKKYQELQLEIAENEILQKIKERYDTEFLVKAALSKALQKRTPKDRNNNPMYS